MLDILVYYGTMGKVGSLIVSDLIVALFQFSKIIPSYPESYVLDILVKYVV